MPIKDKNHEVPWRCMGYGCHILTLIMFSPFLSNLNLDWGIASLFMHEHQLKLSSMDVIFSVIFYQSAFSEAYTAANHTFKPLGIESPAAL